nr:effector-associated domain EAD1-containing protein [Brasilonema bromeliae]
MQQFHKALLSAFPTTAKLKQMVRFKLDDNLDARAGGANHSEVVSNLIVWAKAEGRLEELLTAARKENPGNQNLRRFDEQIRGG